MIDVVGAIIANGLTTFVLVLMLKDLDGPFDIFAWLRTFLMKYKMMDAWLECVWCMSTWFSLPLDIYAIASFGLSWFALPLIWLGAVAISGFIYGRIS